MKRIVCTVALLALGLVASPAQAQTKIAVVDLQKVFDGYWRTKQASVQMQERKADFEKAYNGLVEDFKKASDEFRKQIEAAQDPALSAEAKDGKRKELEKKQGELREQETSLRTFQNNSGQALSEQLGRMRESVLRDITGVVTEKSKAGGYNLVFDTAARSINQTPILLYTTLIGTEVDLSDAVLKQLNANAPPEGTKAADAPPTATPEPKK